MSERGSSRRPTRRARTSPRGSAIASTVAALLVTATGGVACATPNFPPAIQKTVGAARAPDCLVCHDSEAGGVGTVTTTFGRFMVSRGLIPYDVSSLQAALAADKAEAHVSNGVGVDDIEALSEGLDPNVGASAGPSAAPAGSAPGCNVGRAAVGGEGALDSVLVWMFLRLTGRR